MFNNPPVVESMTPTTATYGSTVTIRGSGFGAKGTLAFAQPAATAAIDPSLVQSWSNSQIVARVPFPATAGPIHLTAVDGECDTTTFTPQTPWVPGDAVTMPAILETRPLANGGAAVLGLDAANRVTLAVFEGGTATTTVLDGIAPSTDDRTPILARLVLDTQGRPIVFATNLDGNIVQYVDGVPTDSGLAGAVMAAGRDATGPYVWMKASDSFRRARPGAHPFAIDRGPIADDNALDAQVADDGTLVIARSVDANILFDNEAYLGVARLAPSAAAFVLGEDAESFPWDDYIAAAHLRISPDGARMFATYSTQQYDESSDHPRPPVVRDAAGNWTTAQGILDGHQPLAYLATTIAALTDRADGPALVPDVASSTTEPLPLWPATAAALVLNGTALRPLVQLGDQLWYPTPPSP